MKLLLIGHEDRYAVEQLQLALFPLEPMEPMTAEFEGDGAVSRLNREGRFSHRPNRHLPGRRHPDCRGGDARL